MPYESFIGLRYLMSKKRSSRVVSIITVISISGVALGVTALIVVLSVMGGFKKDLKQKILGTKAHIIVQGVEQTPIKDYGRVANMVMKVEGVVGASPFTEHEVMLSSPAGLSGVMLRGIDLERVGTVTELPKEIIKGKLEYLNDDAGLMQNLSHERDKELDELLEKIRKERDEIKHLKKELKGDAASKEDSTVGPSLPALGEGGPAIKDIVAGDTKLIPSPAFKTLEGDELVGKPLDPVMGDAVPGEPAAKETIPGEAPAPVYEDVVILPGAEDIPDLPGDDSGEMPSILGDGESPALPGEDGKMPGFDTEPAAQRKLPGLIVGPELAKSLQVSIGDEVNVVSPQGEIGPMGRMPKSRPFRVVGIFYTGMYEYDANFAYTRIEDAQDFTSFEGVKGVELKVNNVDRAMDIAGTIKARLGDKYQVLDWMEMNRSLFYALKLEKIAMFVVLTFIILVASFSIIAMLIMIVIEKGREIALLKSLGASDAGIMRTFIFQGTVIGMVGAMIGLGLGLLICYLLMTFGFPLNSEVYYISTLPVDMDPAEVASIVVCAIGISMLATIYPSIQAARLKPVDGLRDD